MNIIGLDSTNINNGAYVNQLERLINALYYEDGNEIIKVKVQ